MNRLYSHVGSRRAVFVRYTKMWAKISPIVPVLLVTAWLSILLFDSRASRTSVNSQQIAYHVIPNRTERIRLFISIGSSPKHFSLRQAIRDTWLLWLEDYKGESPIVYKFFTETTNMTVKEQNTHGDIVLPKEVGVTGYKSFMVSCKW